MANFVEAVDVTTNRTVLVNIDHVTLIEHDANSHCVLTTVVGDHARQFLVRERSLTDAVWHRYEKKTSQSADALATSMRMPRRL